MAHFDITLTQHIEIGAVRRIEWDKEIVRTDGGNEVRNSRWSAPLRSFDVSLPPCRRDNADYLSVLDLWNTTQGGADTFNFTDWTDETGATILTVRFDTPLQITGMTPDLDHIDTFTLQEVRG